LKKALGLVSAAARTELFVASRPKFLVAIAFLWTAAAPTVLFEMFPVVTLLMPFEAPAAEKLLLKLRFPKWPAPAPA
jgi:hypothetical protein